MKKKMMGKSHEVGPCSPEGHPVRGTYCSTNVAKHLQVHTESGTCCLTDKQCSILTFPEEGTIHAAVSSKTENTF